MCLPVARNQRRQAASHAHNSDNKQVPTVGASRMGLLSEFFM
jgi:hypothetical protein